MKWEKKQDWAKKNPLSAAARTPIIINSFCIALLTPSVYANDGLGERWFLGGSLGQSRLEPNTSNTIFNIGDDSDTLLSVSLGYDLGNWLAIEGYAADMGSAGIDAGTVRKGEISYSSVGASLLGYLPVGSRKSVGAYNLGKREGLSLYARIGVGVLDTYTELPADQKQDFHLLTGAGIEYGWKSGLALRLEGTAYDEDASTIGLGLVKRFGEAVQSSGLPLIENHEIDDPKTPAPSALKDNHTQPAQPAPPPASAIIETANAESKPAKKRRAFFELTLPIIVFEVQNKDDLVINDEDVPALTALAETLKQNTDLQLDVEGYQANLKNQQSAQTSKKVIRYLLSRGVKSEQLHEVPTKQAQPSELLSGNRVEFSLADQ